jgi:hypothetical protein
MAASFHIFSNSLHLFINHPIINATKFSACAVKEQTLNKPIINYYFGMLVADLSGVM